MGSESGHKFEDMSAIVDNEIAKRRNRWQLKAIPSIDFDDISQIIRLHIWIKWSQWDQKRPLEPWLNRVITNQINNLVRNLYGNFSRPCLSCAANQGGSPPDGLCAIFEKQCNACPIFAHWEKHKKDAHDTKLPLPLVGIHEQEVFNMPQDSSDQSKEIDELHSKMKIILNPVQYKFYDLFYIQGLPEEKVAKLMGYATTEKNRKSGYKQIPALKRIIIEKAKKAIERDL